MDPDDPIGCRLFDALALYQGFTLPDTARHEQALRLLNSSHSHFCTEGLPEQQMARLDGILSAAGWPEVPKAPAPWLDSIGDDPEHLRRAVEDPLSVEEEINKSIADLEMP